MLIVLDAVLKATVILACAALAAALFRRGTAAARHFVWTLGVVGALAAPLLSLALPHWNAPIVRVPAPVSPGPVAAIEPTLSNHPQVQRPLARRLASDASPLRPTSAASPTALAPSIPPIAVAALVWAAGAMLILFRMLAGLAAVQWLSRRTRAVTDAPWLPLAGSLAGALGLRRVRFLQSRVASMPMAWGVFRPSVLMPADAGGWPADRLRIVLLHELAHVKRRDCLTHLLAQIACAVYWFNPLAWLAAKRLRVERERACDDLVLASGTRGPEYADQLLDIARVMTATRFPAVFGGASLAMAHRSQLEGRLMAILDPSIPRRGISRGRAVAATALFSVLLLPVASLRPWAEERPTLHTDAAALHAVAVAPQAKPAPAPRPRIEVHRSVEVKPQDTQAIVQNSVQSVVDAVVQGVAGLAEGISEGVGRGVGRGVGQGVGRSVGAGIGEAVAAGIASAVQDVASADTRVSGVRRPLDPRTINALIEALKDSDEDVRAAAMMALTGSRDPRLFELLVAALKDKSGDLRQKAAFTLGRLHDGRAVDPLMAALHDPSPDVREAAVFSLGQLHDPRAVEPLMSALKDEKENVREQAAFALGQLHDRRAVEALVIALKDTSDDVREQCAFALGQLRDPRAIDALTAALKDMSADVREQAAFALGRIR